jgi:hypothetical protein
MPARAASVDSPKAGRPIERLRVLARRRDVVDGWLEEDVLWPKNWPLPAAGSIFSGHVVAGFVEHVEFDLPAQRLIVKVR